MVTFTYLAEIVGNLAIFGLLAQLWALPFLIYLYVVDINTVNKWTAFGHDRAARLPEHARHPGGLELAELELDDSPRYRRGNRVSSRSASSTSSSTSSPSSTISCATGTGTGNGTR
ncbi:hypothetical protein T310_6324 [Rasamsonia emersonii CBS 393.64]|uniref:Uncharacterized protein n=1 Tax=Rasamsonia emersonii (strain ATCC 16479 / CBS 393.64 / IMI 116815) TaxID=1408163 RepID=A0A0F4YN92_RASE3|nr:hypothetical protein T310_6324 [Rasamsonia emersonii CBS 393.64]KKA19694.1 hypothetical protein T310_6324 [Rasamsonia emersonii CBS 393.64]